MRSHIAQTAFTRDLTERLPDGLSAEEIGAAVRLVDAVLSGCHVEADEPVKWVLVLLESVSRLRDEETYLSQLTQRMRDQMYAYFPRYGYVRNFPVECFEAD